MTKTFFLLRCGQTCIHWINRTIEKGMQKSYVNNLDVIIRHDDMTDSQIQEQERYQSVFDKPLDNQKIKMDY